MIKEFENMNRREMIQYITLVINYFYNMYDRLTEEEIRYIREYIMIMNKAYKINEVNDI